MRTVRVVILLTASLSAASAIGFPAHPARDAEMQRHKIALMEIRKREIDAKAEYQSNRIACGRSLDCMKGAKLLYADAVAEYRIARTQEDALFRKNMLELKVRGEPSMP